MKLKERLDVMEDCYLVRVYVPLRDGRMCGCELMIPKDLTKSEARELIEFIGRVVGLEIKMSGEVKE